MFSTSGNVNPSTIHCAALWTLIVREGWRTSGFYRLMPKSLYLDLVKKGLRWIPGIMRLQWTASVTACWGRSTNAPRGSRKPCVSCASNTSHVPSPQTLGQQQAKLFLLLLLTSSSLKVSCSTPTKLRLRWQYKKRGDFSSWLKFQPPSFSHTLELSSPPLFFFFFLVPLSSTVTSKLFVFRTSITPSQHLNC